MRIKLNLFLFSVCFLSLNINAQKKDMIKSEIDYVNPFIGTSFAGIGKGTGGGGTMPCVGVPFAMTNFNYILLNVKSWMIY